MSLRVEATRGSLVESVHRVSLAVATPEAQLVAWAGSPELVTFWRSAAKPFQAVALVADGAADRFGFDSAALALACASHSSEANHLLVASRMLERAGIREQELACGPHPPLAGLGVGGAAVPAGAFTPRWSNCSGKHAAMLALARNHDWSRAGYERIEHPVQQRILVEVSRWTGVPPERIGLGTDGCAAPCFALPLHAMATAYARLAVGADPSLRRLRDAMMQHPDLVAGTGRACTDVMAAFPGEVVAKVGADGIYCAALPSAGLGLALKVEDGDMRSSPPALLFTLAALAGRLGVPRELGRFPPVVARHAEPAIINTRGMATGRFIATGDVRFSD